MGNTFQISQIFSQNPNLIKTKVSILNLKFFLWVCLKHKLSLFHSFKQIGVCYSFVLSMFPLYICKFLLLSVAKLNRTLLGLWSVIQNSLKLEQVTGKTITRSAQVQKVQGTQSQSQHHNEKIFAILWFWNCFLYVAGAGRATAQGE